MQREILQTWFFPHPAEKIWEHLTRPELLRLWLMESDFQPVVGHKFRFDTKPKVKLGFDGIVYCEVLEVVPLKRLSYSWKGGVNGKMNLDSIVIWTLEPKENGTQLRLEHKGFRGLRNMIPYLIMNKGWQIILRKRLTDLLNRADGTNRR